MFVDMTRLAKAALGTVLLILGVVLLPLPGPGSLVIVGGLAVLSSEFDWARRALDEMKTRIASARDRVRGQDGG